MKKSLLALVGDIARRLILANPSLENPLYGEGIVLIDEIELHLHPKWQREVINKLREVFPNIQFILTTHSPQVISEISRECLHILSWNNKQQQPVEAFVVGNSVTKQQELDRNKIANSTFL